MFTKPTTFVIGAGCSREYGFPLGYGLRDQIADMLEQVKIERPRSSDRMIFTAGPTSTDREFNAAVQRAAGPVKYQAWFATCQQMAQGLRHASSIDRYLDHHNDDPVMVQIGKMAIGRRILKAEAESSLFTTPGSTLNMPEIAKKNDHEPHWLNELFLRLQEGVRRGNIGQILSNVTFVCFNYDRVIEHYIFNAVKTFGNLSDDQATDAMSHLKIYHPYGRLGHLPWEEASTGDPVAYGAKIDDPDDIADIGANLRIFTETIEENDEILCIRDAILNADNLVFLGFSFLQQNLNLIRPASRSKAQKVYATSLGMSGLDLQVSETGVSNMLNGANSLQFRSFPFSASNTKAGRFMADAGNFLRG